MKHVVASVVLCAVVCSGVALAQETTGAIIGTVTSEDGQPLPGATLKLRDDDKGFERTAITAADGRYKLVALQPARYELTATMAGFQSVKRPIRVELGRTVTNDVQMKLGAVTQTIEVTGEAPLVDVTSTVTGMTVNADEFTARIPVGREVTQIALMAPSSVESDRRFNSGYTPGQQLVAIGGSSPAENGYQVNGLEVTNFRNMLGSTFVPMEFVEEVQVKTGGYEAEYGRATGGVINMVTKSGTNRLRGSVSAYAFPESLQSTEPDAWDRHNTEESFKSLEANASLGGAILRDKLFFFGFIRYDDTEDLQNRSGLSAGIGYNRLYENTAPYYGGKLDWSITPNHRVEGTWLSDFTDLTLNTFDYDPETRTQGGLRGTGWQSRGGENYILKYTGILSDSFLLSAQAGVNNFDRTDSSDRDDCYYAVDYRSGSRQNVGCWVNWQIAVGADKREAYRIDLDWFLGDHSLRGGIDSQKNVSIENSEYSGGAAFDYFTNGFRYQETASGTPLDPDDWLVRQAFFQVGGSYDTFSNAVYVQDSWAMSSRLTVNLGIRWELYENRNALGETFSKINDQYAPRVGAVWDPTGKGRQKLFASVGRYHLPIASNTNIRLAGLLYFVDDWYVFPADAIINPDGSPSELGEFIESIVWADGVVPDADGVRATNLTPMSQDELIVGYEAMVGPSWSLGARFVTRDFNEVIEDITLDEGLNAKYGIPVGVWAYYLANPGSDFEGFFDLDNDGVLDPISLTAEELGFPYADRQYYAVELMARRRFASNWMAQIAYTWSQSYGNYEGWVKSDLGQDDAGLTQDFDIPGLMDNAYGFLPNHRTHNFKAFGAYAWDFGLQVGGYLYYRSGRPRNAIGLHPTDPFAQLYGASSFFYADGTPAPRGTVGRTDDLYGVDATVKYDFRTAGIDWWVRLDVFNLLDNDAIVYYGEYSTTHSGTPYPSFGQPIYYQEPRRVRFGFGVSF